MTAEQLNEIFIFGLGDKIESSSWLTNNNKE
jgi:hypothetical protein